MKELFLDPETVSIICLVVPYIVSIKGIFLKIPSNQLTTLLPKTFLAKAPKMIRANKTINRPTNELSKPNPGKVTFTNLSRGSATVPPSQIAVSYTHLTLPTKRIV